MIQRDKTDSIVVHCSQTPKSMDIGVDKIAEWHIQQNGWEDVGYHWIIKRDGTIESARPEDMKGAHAPAANHRSIAICLIGGSQDDGKGWENNFTNEQFESLKNKITDIQDRYEITHIIGHRDVDDRKECPAFDVGEWAKDNGLV